MAKNYMVTSKGFTLVETLVAVTILIVGVLGPLNVATRGITDGFYVKNQVTATYLAQEGLDLTTNLIRNNLSDLSEAQNNWLNGLGGCENGDEAGSAICNTSLISGDFNSCSGDECDMRYCPNLGLYLEVGSSCPGGWFGSAFSRSIRLVVSGDGDLSGKQAKIEVVVRWLDKINPRSVTLTQYIYNDTN